MMLRSDIQPSVFHFANRVIVIGDIHGDVQTFMRCMYAARLFNTNLEWIAEPKDTIVVQLGDQVDGIARGGSDTWETLPDVEMIYLTERLDQIARMKGGRVLSILGNHELMNVLGDFSYVSPRSRQKLDLVTRESMFRPGGSIARILAKRNVVLRIGNILFCHGGLLPHHLILTRNHTHVINEITRKYLLGVSLTPVELAILNACVIDGQSILWSRMYVDLYEHNRDVLLQAVDDVLKNTYCEHIIVGHNTVGSIQSLFDNKIIMTDVGLSRAYPSTQIQFVEILHVNTPQQEIRTLTIPT